MASQPDPKPEPASRGGLGYKSFVAWRYLLVARRKVTPQTTLALLVGVAALIVVSTSMLALPAGGTVSHQLRLAQLGICIGLASITVIGVLRHSKAALLVFLIGAFLVVVAAVGTKLIGVDRSANSLELVEGTRGVLLQFFNGVGIFGAVLAGLSMFFGLLRAYFTFFTTVPIGGVWIGTSALVAVLSVMSGFESDLRSKILGSNAHIQITREDGDFTEWRDVKAKVDKMPGVVASTPYAVSEVVVAANNTGMPVIIKGIDPKTVGAVTDLVSDLKDDPDAMKRLEPIAHDTHDLSVPQHPRSGKVIDPPPDDLPTPGDPIDFSIAEPAARPEAGEAAGSGQGSSAGSGQGSSAGSGQGSSAHHGSAGSAADGVIVDGELLEAKESNARALDALARELDQPTGADRARTAAAAHPVIDPAPSDLVTNDAPPIDFSKPAGKLGLDALSDAEVVKVIDVPFDSPSLSRRTQSLPGMLVGKELVKQTHLYNGEEVRVVSPLSDPSNPDATGTPIPFNRDYRVAGVFYTGMYEYDLKYVYVSLESLQDFLDRGDAVDGIEVRVTDPDQTAAFTAQFEGTFGPGYRVLDWKELNRSLFSALKLEKIAMFLVLGIVILVASFSIVGNLIMVVVEKQKEIALLKTLGASDFGIMQLFAIQGMMIGLIGTLLGVATGLAACWAGKTFGLPLNPDVYYIDKLPINVDPLSVAAAAAAGIVISIAATLYPAVVAARIRPAAGMRH